MKVGYLYTCAVALLLVLLSSYFPAVSFESKGERYNAAMDAFRQGAYKRTYDILIPLAKAGDPKAQGMVGHLYQKGLGLEQNLKVASRWYLKSAKQGNSASQYNLALLYFNGHINVSGVSGDKSYVQGENDKSAVYWLKKAVQQGNIAAHTTLATAYKHGRGIRKNAATAMSLYRSAAASGDSNAMVGIGLLYAGGRAVDRDFKKAAKWYRKAADSGNLLALGYLGDLFYYGMGFQKDYQEAHKWYLNGALKKNMHCEFRLGVLYDSGLGVKQNNKKAMYWLKLSANQGYHSAHNLIGVKYEKGIGVSQDYGKAAKWYRSAIKNGSKKALTNLGLLYRRGLGVKIDYKLAMKLFRDAGDKETFALINIGDLYEKGLGVSVSGSIATKWYQRAAAAGDPYGYYKLGSMYFAGKVVKKNMKTALKWFRKAARKGDKFAMGSIGNIYEYGGPGIKKNDKRAYEWFLKAANRGETVSQVRLGNWFENGKFVAEDEQKAIEWYRRAAIGNGVPCSDDQLEKWFQKNNTYCGILSTRGNIEAKYLLAKKYETGVGVAKNEALALDLYKAVYNGRTFSTVEKKSEALKDIVRLEAVVRSKGVQTTHILPLIKVPKGPYKVRPSSAGGVIVSNKNLDYWAKNPDEYNSQIVAKFEIQQARVAELERENKKLAARLQKSSNSSIDLDISWGKYYAIVIGNNDYKYLKKLMTPVNDAKVISKLLRENYGFETTLLTNATRKQIVRVFNKFKRKLKSNDNLLIYYAGHGEYDKEASAGYWQPIDAEPNDNTQWILNETITSILRGTKANNILLVADSCYSGTVFRSGGLQIVELGDSGREEVYRRLLEEKTRVALTSGGDEPVPDSVHGSAHSVFAKSLIDTLSENTRVLRASSLAHTVTDNVVRIMSANNIKQTPEFSDMRNAGHDGGDFLFVPRYLQKK